MARWKQGLDLKLGLNSNALCWLLTCTFLHLLQVSIFNPGLDYWISNAIAICKIQ